MGAPCNDAEKIASMGPPSEKGGICKMNAALLRIGYASMGPPSEKGGIRGRYGYVNNSASGFNGAALREGRNHRDDAGDPRRE